MCWNLTNPKSRRDLTKLWHQHIISPICFTQYIETAQEYVLQENPELLPDLCRLQTDIITLPKALGYEATRAKTKPIMWWKCIVSSESVSNELSSLALKLLSLSASAASMERIFSNFELIQTKLINRLRLDKASKLVMCYRCLSWEGGHRLVICFVWLTDW